MRSENTDKVALKWETLHETNRLVGKDNLFHDNEMVNLNTVCAVSI